MSRTVYPFRTFTRSWARCLLQFSGMTVGMVLATATATAEPVRPLAEKATVDQGHVRADENEAWFARFLLAQATSPSDLPAGQPPSTRNRPPLTPLADPPPAITAPSVDPPRSPAEFNPPGLAAPDLLNPDVPTPELSPLESAPTDDTRFTLFREPRSRANFARRRRPIAVLGDSMIDLGQIELRFTAHDQSTWPPSPLVASASTDIPLIAAATRRRLSENGSVLPTDRIVFSYQHFRNAFSTEVSRPGTGVTRRTLNLDRATIGMEKTLFDGQWSFDVRLPVESRFDVAAPDFSLTNGRLGNASLVLKHLWYESEAVALGVGLGLDFPTGSDGQIELPRSQVFIRNDAYHALPYVGILMAPTENSTVQAFAQLDIPLNGNELEVRTPSEGSFFRQFDEQELLFLSISAAR